MDKFTIFCIYLRLPSVFVAIFPKICYTLSMEKHFQKQSFSFSIAITEQKKLRPHSPTAELSWDLSRSRLFDPSFFRIWIILKGRGRVTTQSGTFEVMENRAYCMPPNSIVSTELYGEMEQYYIDFFQSPNEVPMDQLYEFRHWTSTDNVELLLALARSLYSIYKNDDEISTLKISSTLTSILSYFIVQSSSAYGKFNKAIEYISRHYNQPLSLTYLANLCDYSPEYFSNKFKLVFGVSPQKFIINKRLTQAKILLISTNKSIREIGEEIGYPDQMHFSKIFTKENTLSPSVYRKKYRRGGGVI